MSNAGKGDSPGYSQRALPGKPPAAPSPRRKETRSLHHQRRINSNMRWQTSAACPAAFLESLRRDPYVVKLYGITVPPSCLVPVSCSLSLPLSHTLSPAHRGAPPPRNPCPGRSQRCGRCPRPGPGCSRRGTGMGLPQHPAHSLPPAAPPRPAHPHAGAAGAAAAASQNFFGVPFPGIVFPDPPACV